MLGIDEVKSILAMAIAHSPADQTEALILTEESGLTRFANSSIHQNVAETNVEIRIRAVWGKRVGVATTNVVTPDAVRAVVDQASSIARLQAENPDFVSLPGPLPIATCKAFQDRTAGCSPDQRARMVGVICRKAREKGMSAAGALSTGSYEIAVANSLGVFGYHPYTVAEINTVITAEDSTGYADAMSIDVDEIDAGKIADEAIDKSFKSRNPILLQPGEYEVVLEEYATSDIVDFLAQSGLSALAVQENRSFMNDRFGQKILDPAVSIWDDGLDPNTLPMPFDYEGVPKQRVALIDRGIATGVVYDSYTARKEGRESTGHALPAPNTYGPIPINTFLAPGAATKEDMVRQTGKGIWVSRFWYTRTVHPLTVEVTGMTRDGTFLIENGEITRAVKNFRFTQGYLEALNNVQLIGNPPKLQRTWMGANRVPALKIARWNFTSVTEY